MLQVSWYGLSGTVTFRIRVTKYRDVYQTRMIKQRVGVWVEDVLAPRPVPSHLAQSRRVAYCGTYIPDASFAAVCAAHEFVIEIWVRHCDAPLRRPIVPRHKSKNQIRSAVRPAMPLLHPSAATRNECRLPSRTRRLVASKSPGVVRIYPEKR